MHTYIKYVLLTLRFHVVCISWIIKCLILLMHGVTMKIMKFREVLYNG